MRGKETWSDALWLLCPANSLLGHPTAFKRGQNYTRQEEWEFTNMKVTLILRILKVPLHNTSSALTFLYIFWLYYFLLGEKGDTSSLSPGL